MSMKAKRKAVRRGRKRSTEIREPNGRVSRAGREPDGPAILDEAVTQRARAMGVECVTVDAELRKAMQDEWAGYPLGRLRLKGLVTDRQFRAGISYAVLRRRWDSLVEAPNRHAKVARLPIASENPADMAPQVIDMLAMERESDVDGAWLRAKLHVRKLRRRIGSAEALSVLEAVCVEEVAPQALGWLPLLRTALDLVADHFRLEPDDAEAVALKGVWRSLFVNK
ncbi:hypothetical protein [Azospirillum agricola]|uniref:hypothetical protein n=1 Tax=Azospirillum agricola TaxID=1720247 RepID=UPI000A0EF448|nr:hypothetical protein [Azospirillum agricola]SMH30600.1 hypothetical protein SAMN02982994_0348 [Azospirillum lipoferum]